MMDLNKLLNIHRYLSQSIEVHTSYFITQIDVVFFNPEYHHI
jgi:hypothetical protein